MPFIFGDRVGLLPSNLPEGVITWSFEDFEERSGVLSLISEVSIAGVLFDKTSPGNIQMRFGLT